MPWKRETPMDQRIKLVADWLSGAYSKMALSRRYGVSRPTVDKWLKRYEMEGAAGLEDRSRAPHTTPHRTPSEVVNRLVAAKLAHRDWGPKKLVWYLAQQSPEVAWPAASTAGEILKREGLVATRRRHRRTPVYSQPFGNCTTPNAVWSIDYKGQFRTGDGRWCYPLTLTDNASRYLLVCRGLRHPRRRETWPWLEWAFQEYGLPQAIRSDNGAPFASTGLGGLSPLSVWWIKLGITPERISPGRPDQNGRHERMHRTLKAATLRPPAEDLHRQQAAFTHFQQEFNAVRPHEALGMATPASQYVPSPRPYPAQVPEIEYDGRFEVRRVRSSGEIKWQGQRLYVSDTLIGEWVALRQSENDEWTLYFSTLPIARWKHGAPRFEHLKV